MSVSSIFNFQNINTRILLRDILRRLWMAALIAIVGAMIMYMYIRSSYVPVYTSSAVYVVAPKQSTGYSFMDKSSSETAIEVFQNLLGAEIMINHINDEMNTKTFDAEISAELIPETNLMTLTAKSKDPVVSYNVVKATMKSYKSLSDYMNSGAIFEEIKEPVVSFNPENILVTRKKTFQVGAICGLVVIGLIALASIMRKTIKNEAAVEGMFGVDVLGTIWHQSKNRTIKSKIVQSVKSLLITSPVMSARFIESINSIRIKLEYEHERHPDKNIYLFSSVCENEGKSTVSLNVALSLANEGKKVIVLDGDLRKPAIYKMLDIPRENVVDYTRLLHGECGLDQVIYNEKRAKLNLIMASKGHSDTHETVKTEAMRDLIKKCSKMADYVIIDTPPMALVTDAEELLDCVDFSVLVVRQDMSYEGDITNAVNIMSDSPAKFMGIVLNNYTAFENNISNPVGTSTYGKKVEVYGE